MAVDKQPSRNNAATVDRLAQKALRKSKLLQPNQRLLIAISGVPGSGKTTLAALVASQLRTQLASDNSVAIVPMDGYHFYRSQLSAMPNAAEAIHRRGAAFTFDSTRYLELVTALREPITVDTPTIYAPSFDHHLKDPVEDDIAISPETKVVVFEGLYLSLDREPWSSAARLMDESWFIHVDREVSRERLVKRHVASGIVPDVQAAEHRVSSTDMLNADEILAYRLPVSEFIA